MSVTKKGVSPEAAEEPVGQSSPKAAEELTRLKEMFKRGRRIARGPRTAEHAFEGFDLLVEVDEGHVVWDGEPGSRRFPARSNPWYIKPSHYEGNSCKLCSLPLEPPEPLQQHFYKGNGMQHLKAYDFYHPACWDEFYAKAVSQGPEAVEALLLWEYDPSESPQAKPHVAAPQPAQATKKKAKAAAKQTKPHRQKAAVRHRVVPTSDTDEKFKKVPREITKAFLRTPELKVDFGVPSTGVKAEVDRILAHKLSRVFATTHHCRDGTIRGTYTVMRQEYLADLIAKGRAQQPAPMAVVKPPVPVTVRVEDDDTPDPPEGFFPGFFRRASEWLGR